MAEDDAVSDLPVPVSAFVDTAKQNEEFQSEHAGLIGVVQERLDEAAHSRLGTEARWLKSYLDYRGKYSNSVNFKDSEQSRVFVKIAKTKTLAAYGQLCEIVFSAGKFPISIKPTEKPSGIPEKAHLEEEAAAPEEEIESVGFAGDGFKSAAERLGVFANKFRGANLVPGPAKSPDQPQINSALETARKMEKTIHDQLTENQSSRELRKTLFEKTLYGTGVLKGPYSFRKTQHKWQTDGEGSAYTPQTLVVPRNKNVSVWRCYPDPSATCAEDMEYMIERHKYSKHDLRKLQRQPYFNKEAILQAIQRGPNYINKGYEDSLRDDDNQNIVQNRWEVLEYWGVMDLDMALAAGLEVPESVTELDEVSVNIWICAGEVLRIVYNPFEPQRIPYNFVPYEFNPDSIWGIGVPENMADSTLIMNGHARMAIDNLALSGHMMLDVNEDSMVGDQDYVFGAGKIFRRRTGAAGQGVFGIKFPNTTKENLEMFDKFRQLADEQTGIPSYSHGGQGGQGTTRTASGMSMLMGAAALNIKTVIKNLDDYLLEPVGRSYYYWNMQFNDDPDIKGDLDVKAEGTDAVMQKEVRSQRLTQFLQVVANPALAPFVKLDKIVKEIAISLDLDAEDIVNNQDEAKIYASIIGAAGQLNMNSTQSIPTAPDQATTAPTGDTGVPAPALPGEQGFSGTVQ